MSTNCTSQKFMITYHLTCDIFIIIVFFSDKSAKNEQVVSYQQCYLDELLFEYTGLVGDIISRCIPIKYLK